MTNIFMISPRMGDEDRFTAHWHYMLANNPDLGQQVLDHISQRAGLPPSRFDGCEDHPAATREDRPDFMLRAADYDILCEHKLESPLGHRQLERYLDLARKAGRKTYLAFVANNSGLALSREVLCDEHYLRPGDCVLPYFLWQDFLPLFRHSPNPMASEFADYMESLGMDPWQFGEWDDPFADPDSANQFRQLWRPVKAWFKDPERKQPGNLVRPDRAGLGCQVQKPLRGIHLIYFEVSKSRMARARDCGIHHFSGRGIYMRVILNKNRKTDIAELPHVKSLLTSDRFAVSVATPEEPTIYKGLYCAREYAISMDELLADNFALSQERMLAFVSLAVGHLQEDILEILEYPVFHRDDFPAKSAEVPLHQV